MSNEKNCSIKQERNLFLFICIVLFPLLSIVVVGGYGFIIWMSQLVFGPPVI